MIMIISANTDVKNFQGVNNNKCMCVCMSVCVYM